MLQSTDFTGFLPDDWRVPGFDAVERVGHCVHWGYKSPQSLRFSMSVAGLCGNETGSATGVQVLGFDGAWLGLP